MEPSGRKGASAAGTAAWIFIAVDAGSSEATETSAATIIAPVRPEQRIA